jgi:ArsR family transcriptional regulator, arsenate/arsenite/antimonite-responsive transcriptional repressor
LTSAQLIVALTSNRYLYQSGDMEKSDVIAALGALAQDTRLDMYRLLVQAGPKGMPAGHIGEQLGLPSATLAFHLKELRNAGLATYTRNGRLLIYAAAYSTMTALLEYLTENCCQGNPAACGLPTDLAQGDSKPLPSRKRSI